MALQSTSKVIVDTGSAGAGLTLVAPYGTKDLSLVDEDGNTVHTWSTDRLTRGTVELLPNGTLLRGRSGPSGQEDGIHILDLDGTVLWDYQLPDGYDWHHDIEPLPNGNILLTVRVIYDFLPASELGRDPQLIRNLLWMEPIIEVKPKGRTGGDIVWKWDPVDHLIQDYSSDLSNYGVISEHPELININFPRTTTYDWQHTNGVAYNAELDQVIITNRNIGEIWVIDHNTSMEEAAGHTGGAHGRGGDLLYRWGNPQAYGAGDIHDQVLFGPHDAHWIPSGYPGEGNIMIFNNGNDEVGTRPEGLFSSIDEIVPPLNSTGGYDLSSGSAYGPSGTIWNYTADPPRTSTLGPWVERRGSRTATPWWLEARAETYSRSTRTGRPCGYTHPVGGSSKRVATTRLA